jgi:hypothetical protein
MLVIEEFCRSAKLEKSFRLRLKHAIKFITEKTTMSQDEQLSVFKEFPR